MVIWHRTYGKGPLNERERNVLFNDALNTFYLRLYGVRHMVKDHSDSERGNPLLPHRLLLLINSKGSFICTIPHRITHTTTFVTPVVEHWLEREIADHSMKEKICCHHYKDYSFRLAARVILYATPPYRTAHTMTFGTPVSLHWLEREIIQWVHH